MRPAVHPATDLFGKSHITNESRYFGVGSLVTDAAAKPTASVPFPGKAKGHAWNTLAKHHSPISLRTILPPSTTAMVVGVMKPPFSVMP